MPTSGGEVGSSYGNAQVAEAGGVGAVSDGEHVPQDIPIIPRILGLLL
jgi:hypothetical protein